MGITVQDAFPFQLWEFVWYLLVFVLGSVGNITVLLVILLHRRINRKSTFNIMMLSLATTDLLISIVGLPIYIMSTNAYQHPAGKNGDDLCMFFTGYFLPFWLLDVSVFILVIIALERRRIIINPLSVLEEDKFWTKFMLVVGAILLGLALGLPTIFGLKYTATDPMVGNYCTYRYTFIQSISIYFFVFTIDTIIPIVILSVSFQQIKKLLEKNEALLRDSSIQLCYRNENKHSHELVLRKKRKTIETMKYVVLAFFICIVPNHLLYLLSLAGVKGLEWNSVVCQIGVLMRFSNSCVNPFLYCFKSREFRKNFQETFNLIFKYTGRKMINERDIAYVTVNQNIDSAII